MYFGIESKKQRVLAHIRETLGITPFLELTAVRVSVEFKPENGNTYQISLLDENRRNKQTDKGVEKNHLFIGFDLALFLGKEKEKGSGWAFPVPYPDGAIFNGKGTPAVAANSANGTAASPEIPSEMESLMTIYNGTFSIEDADGQPIMLPRPVLEFMYTPDTQFKAATQNSTMVLPSYDMSRAFRPVEPFIIVSGNKDTVIKMTLGEGSKASIAGAAGTQNVGTWYLLGFRARSIADAYLVELAKKSQ